MSGIQIFIGVGVFVAIGIAITLPIVLTSSSSSSPSRSPGIVGYECNTMGASSQCLPVKGSTQSLSTCQKFCKSSDSGREYKIEDLHHMFNNEGLLVNMEPISFTCPQYYERPWDWKKFPGPESKKCLDDISQCKLVDMTDLTNLTSKASSVPNALTCFALDCSFLQKDLPIQIFGPVSDGADNDHDDGGWVIGILFDVEKMKKYVGCMSSVDSGSTGRYAEYLIPYEAYDNSTTLSNPNDPVYSVTNDLLKNNYKDLLNVDKYGTVLNAAGCSPYYGSPHPNSYLFADPKNPPVVPNYIPCNWTTVYDTTSNQDGTFIDNNPWFNRNDRYKLYSRDNWEAWKKQTINISRTLAKQVQNNLQTFGTGDYACDPTRDIGSRWTTDYWGSMFPTGDNTAGNGYRETEVDIFLPQSGPRVNGRCQPTAETIHDFLDAIVGIVVNDICPDDVRLFQPYNGAQTCCRRNVDFKRKIAKWLVDTYNKKGYNKIHAYDIVTVNPGDSFSEWVNNGYQSVLKLRYI